MFKGSVKVQVQDFTKVSWGLMEMEAYFSLGGDWHLSNYISHFAYKSFCIQVCFSFRLRWLKQMRRILLIGLAKSQYKIKLRKFKNTQHSAGGGLNRGKWWWQLLLVIFRTGSTKCPIWAGVCLFRWGLPFAKSGGIWVL